MYQDLSFMKVPLPEDVLKLKIYGDYAGAQKMIRYFLEEKDIPQALRKRLEIEQEVIGVMGGNDLRYTSDCTSQNDRETAYPKHFSSFPAPHIPLHWYDNTTSGSESPHNRSHPPELFLPNPAV